MSDTIRGGHADTASTSGRIYRTFTRRARNWNEFSSARKHTIDRNLTIDEARRACAAFNDNRTAAQIKAGTKMEFERH